MEASTKIIRYTSKEENGLAPIVIRITKHGLRSYIFLKCSLPENEWNEEESIVKKNNSNARRLNISFNNSLNEVNKTILDSENKGEDLSARELKVLHEGGGKIFVSFNKLANDYLKKKLNEKKHNQVIADKPKFNTFRDFLKIENLGVPAKPLGKALIKDGIEATIDIDVNKISGALLKKYETYLKSLGQSKSTIYNKLNVIRLVWNDALTQELVPQDIYPFGKSNKKVRLKPGESMKIGLDEDELNKLINVDIDEENEAVIVELKKGVKYIKDIQKRVNDLIHARNVFLFSFGFAGERCADTLKTKWSDFKNGRHFYFIGKNNRPTDVVIPDLVIPILEYYEPLKRSEDDVVFPELKKANMNDSKDIHAKIRTGNRKINADLEIICKIAGITKKVSLHTARHTFGNLAKGNIPPEVLQALYRHSHLSTTVNYQKNWTKKVELDKGLNDVLKFGKRVV